MGVAALLGLLAAGCGSADDNQADSSSNDTVQQGVADVDVTIASDGTPTPGGTLVYALEAETDGWDPTANRWAISGMMVGMAVYDPLTAYNADGEVEPYLAESIEPNETYDEWTITLREGVTFHDGSALTAEAVKATLDGHKASILTGTAVTPIEEVTVDPTNDLVAVVTMNKPWVAFPAALTAQIGFVVSPTTLTDDGGSRDPIGTGPFDFQSWTPNASLETAKYDGYWRTDEDGTQLPYLDGVEFRPFPDNLGRGNALLGGEVNMLHTSNPDTVAKFREEAASGNVQMVEDRGEGEEGFVMLNTESAPLDDVRVREAIALATDSEEYTAVIDGGVPETARGPFQPTSPWYVETDYPEYDLEAATALIDEYTADVGPVVFTLGTTPSPENQEAVQFLASRWGDAGMDVQIETIDQSQFIGDALAGNYQANLWRQFGAIDPDTDSVWWLSESAEGTLDLNFARNKNEAIDAALEEGRTNPDPEARKAAYATFQEELAKDIPYIWLTHTLWAIVADNNVRQITNGPLPSGDPALPLGGTGTFGGTHRLTFTWLDT